MPKPNLQLKSTSKNVATQAAKLLSGTTTDEQVRSVAGSALAQTAPAETPKVKKPKKAEHRIRAFKAGKDL